MFLIVIQARQLVSTVPVPVPILEALVQLELQVDSVGSGQERQPVELLGICLDLALINRHTPVSRGVAVEGDGVGEDGVAVEECGAELVVEVVVGRRGVALQEAHQVREQEQHQVETLSAYPLDFTFKD